MRLEIHFIVLNSCILNLYLRSPAILRYSMRELQRANSRSQPTPRVGNLNGRRRDVEPTSIGSSQPTPRVGNLARRRRDVVPDSVGSGLGTQ